MEIIEAFKNNLVILISSLIGGVGVISIFFAAYTAMMAHGDPQQMAKARNAFFGGIVGLLLGGFAFAIPTILSETVLQPSGGQGFGVQEAGSCDDVLRRELRLQPNANTGARMNQVIRVIQQREEDCLSDNWDPEVAGSEAVPATLTTWVSATGVRASCFAEAPNPGGRYTVDGIEVPSRLIGPEDAASSGTDTVPVPSADSKRDVNDNILVYFSTPPTDLSKCWMYLSRDTLWVAVQ